MITTLHFRRWPPPPCLAAAQSTPTTSPLYRPKPHPCFTVAIAVTPTQAAVIGLPMLTPETCQNEATTSTRKPNLTTYDAILLFMAIAPFTVSARKTLDWTHRTPQFTHLALKIASPTVVSLICLQTPLPYPRIGPQSTTTAAALPSANTPPTPRETYHKNRKRKERKGERKKEEEE